MAPKALILTSDKPRHRFFAATIASRFQAPFALLEQKKSYYTEQLANSEAVRRHFARNAEAEALWFQIDANAIEPEQRRVPDINDPACIEWARDQGFDVVCLYGTGILGPQWLSAFPDRIVNLHLGLSPYYRGSATLFWPFVHRELHRLGTTIHLATAKVDAGNILARVRPDLREQEDYYAITHRLIRDSILHVPTVIGDYLSGTVTAMPQEQVTGRFCRKADFNDLALQSALEYAGTGLSAAEIANIRSLMP